jgi:hypothetical protein
MKNTEIIIQFIPIIIIFILLSYSKLFVKFSFSILGKLIALMIIIFYSSIDIIVGTFICGLVIFYYQTDYVENMLNLDDSIDTNDIINLDFDDIIDLDQLYLNYDTNDIPDDGLYLVPMSDDNKVKQKKPNRQHKNKNPPKKKCKKTKIETMENYSTYDDLLMKDANLIDRFKKENCVKNELKYKDITIKNDIAEHVFPELVFENGEPCNPCNNTCKYSIIEQRLKTEELMKPISTIQI